MQAPRLTSGAVKEIAELPKGLGTIQPVLQVADVRPITAKSAAGSDRFRMLVSDGVHSLQSMLSTDLNRFVADGTLRLGSIVHLLEVMCSDIQGRRIIIVCKLDILQSECDMIGKPKIYETKSSREGQEPNLRATAVAPRMEPVANNLSYGGPYNGVHGTLDSSIGRTVRSGPNNVISRSSHDTMSAQNTMHTNVVQPNPQQPFLNSHQSQRFAVPSTAGGLGPPDNTYVRPAQPSYQQPPPAYRNSGPVTKNEAGPRVTPISALNPYQGTWKIKARVTAKTHVNHYINAQGPGKLFTFDLLDAHGGEIRAKCFKDVVDQFYDLIEVGKVYLISGGGPGGLKPAQKQYNPLNNDFEISMDARTSVEVCSSDDNSIPSQRFNFRQISEIANMDIGAMLDLLGVVTSVSPSSTVTKKNGVKTSKRVLQLKDVSGCSVEITFWGNFCDAEGQQLQLLCDSGSSPILALKSGRIGDFNGRSVGTISSSCLNINPDFPEAERLRQWYITEGKNAAFTSLSVGWTDVRNTVAQIKEEDMGKSEKPDWITVMGTVWNIKTDNFCYPACTAVVNGTRCTKKVTKDVDEIWQCESCEQSSQNCEYRYMLPCQIQDHTGTTTYATAFQDAGEEIIGLPAQDLFKIKHEDHDDEKFAEIIQRARYQHYLFKLKVKEETYNDEARVKCNIVKVQKLDDTAKESRFLLGVIDSLLAEDGSGSTPAVNGGVAINAGFTSNNTYAMNMGFPNQFGQQASLYGGMPSTPSATRYAQTGHVSRDSPVQANSYSPSAGGTASSGLCYKCSQPGHFARDCLAQAAGPQRQTYGNGAATSGGYNRQSYAGNF
ncbi:hypothetical protein QYE76_009347 [Lolium multiflorum]|uniref:Replication protein A subunit n=1 Tax=Lolium multiflorum TaxID=4521 RepID=A0AAD8TRT1_LOLMU|nr:hypothetical protein QYE76_009347 [Lolium multiflorum]